MLMNLPIFDRMVQNPVNKRNLSNHVQRQKHLEKQEILVSVKIRRSFIAYNHTTEILV